MALAACVKGRSTVGVMVTSEPAQTIHSLQLTVVQGDLVWAEQAHEWKGPATYALYVPAEVSGRISIEAEGRDPAGAVVATGRASTTVLPGQVIGPVRLALVPVRPPAEGDAGAADAVPVPDASPDQAADLPVTDVPAAQPDAPRDAGGDVPEVDGAATPDAPAADVRVDGRPAGQPCSAGQECASSMCVDGRCCNEACTGPCRTCASGLCTAITGADDVPACPLGSTCGPGGQCRKKRGQPCQGTAECETGYCVDGVCCNDSCSAPCQSCASGTCSPVRDAPDVPECGGAGRGCDSQGACILPPSQVPTAVWPWNGEATGSVFEARALRPRLRWTAVSGASRYQIEIDDSCSVTGFLGCTFPSPEVTGEATTPAYQPANPLPVSMVKPVGRRYFWRVRACNAVGCSPWSAVRYLDVGRQSRDFNGDGYADVLAGGANHEAWLFLGGASPDAAVDLKLRGLRVAAAGDVNADGYADMIIGESEFGTARAFIHLGGPTLDTVVDVLMTHLGPERFGQRVTGIGDYDADGYADVLVAAPMSDDPGGKVLLFRGGAPMDGNADVVFVSHPDRRFGLSIGPLGDRNGDGYADFAITALSAGLSGDVLIYDGGRVLDRGPGDEATLTGVLSSAPGDLDGDGRGDLVLSDENSTGIFLDGPKTIPTLLITFVKSAMPSVTMGDVDRDGYADLLVGDPTENRAELFRGGAPMDAQRDAAYLTEMPADVFGHSVSVLDLNGDGFLEVVVGASFNDSGAYAAGRIYVHLGGATLDTRADLRFDGTTAQDSLGEGGLASLGGRRPRWPWRYSTGIRPWR